MQLTNPDGSKYEKALACLEEILDITMWDGMIQGGLDGADLQDIFVKHGILRESTLEEKIHCDPCNCRDLTIQYNEKPEDIECYRLAKGFTPQKKLEKQ